MPTSSSGSRPTVELTAVAISPRPQLAGEAVDEGHAEEEERRRERAEQEVLERRLLRDQPAPAGQPGHQVQRQREDLEGDEHRQQVVGGREEQHAADREHREREDLGASPALRDRSLLLDPAGRRRRHRRERVARRVERTLGHQQDGAERRAAGSCPGGTARDRRWRPRPRRPAEGRRSRAFQTTNPKATTRPSRATTSWIVRRCRRGAKASTSTPTRAAPKTTSMGASGPYSIVGVSNAAAAATWITAWSLQRSAARPRRPSAPGRWCRPAPGSTRRPG